MRQAAGRQQHAVVQRQHDEGERRRKIERGRGQERDAQHAHGAPSQFVRRRGQRARLGLRLAVQHDGGDAAHAVEEARLQPRQRQELAARRGRRADTRRRHRDRDQQAAQNQHERADRIGQQRGERHQQRAADRQRSGRQPAGVQPVQRLDAVHDDRGQLAGVVRAQPRRAGMQQARQRVGPQPPPRRRPRIERGALGRNRRGRAQHGEHREAPPAVPPCRRRARSGRRRAASPRTRPGPRPLPCRAGRTARPAMPPGRRCAAPHAARRAMLSCCPRIASCRPLSSDEPRWTGRTA